MQRINHALRTADLADKKTALELQPRPVKIVRVPIAKIEGHDTEEWKKAQESGEAWCNTANHMTEENAWADEKLHPWKCQTKYSTAIGATSMDKWLGPLGHLCGPRGKGVVAVPVSNKMAKMRGPEGNAQLAALLETSYPALRETPPDGWFLRLSDCSPKDSPWGGAGPHATLRGALRSIDGSVRSQKEYARAWGAMMQKHLATMFPRRERTDTPVMACDGEEAMTTLYLAPFDKTCDTLRELRCFVHDGRLTAISQYDWFSPTAAFCAMDDARLERIARAVDAFLQRRVLPAFSNEAGGGVSSFTLDVEIGQDADEVRLIELNCFGAHLAAASALFHWLRDHDELHQTGDDAARQPICVRVLEPPEAAAAPVGGE